MTGQDRASRNQLGPDKENQRASERSPEGPVDRAFHLLQTVVAANEPLGVREIGRRTGLARSTAARLILNLERLRMVDRDANGAIIPGGALATLQTSGQTRPLVRDRLQPLLIELVQQFGENAALAVDDGDALLYVSNVNSENAVSVSDVTGERHRFHLVAPGLVAMTFWSTKRLSHYLATPLEVATEHSTTAKAAIRRRLKQTQADGFAWTNQELEVGVNGLAAAIVADGKFIGSVSLYGPSYRFSPKSRPKLGEQFRTLIEQRMGNALR